MNEYRQLESIIAGIFGTAPEYTQEEADRAFLSILKDDEPYQRVLRQELKAAFADFSLSWHDLLQTGGNIFEDFTEHEARQFVVDRVWRVLFPHEDPPGTTK